MSQCFKIAFLEIHTVDQQRLGQRLIPPFPRRPGVITMGDRALADLATWQATVKNANLSKGYG